MTCLQLRLWFGQLLLKSYGSLGNVNKLEILDIKTASFTQKMVILQQVEQWFCGDGKWQTAVRISPWWPVTSLLFCWRSEWDVQGRIAVWLLIWEKIHICLNFRLLPWPPGGKASIRRRCLQLSKRQHKGVRVIASNFINVMCSLWSAACKT